MKAPLKEIEAIFKIFSGNGWVMADDIQGLRVSNARLAGAVGTGPFITGISLVDYGVEKPMGYKGDDDKITSIVDSPNRK